MERNPRELQVFPRPKLSAVAGGVDGLETVPARTLACVHEAGAQQAVGHLQGRWPQGDVPGGGPELWGSRSSRTEETEQMGAASARTARTELGTSPTL